MPNYYINKNAQSSGEHEIHKSNCDHLPVVYNRIELGWFLSDAAAKEAAKKYFYNVDGCKFCCTSIHSK